MKEKLSFFSEDLTQIKEALDETCAYSFAADVSGRLTKRKLSAVELGKRCGVSHAIVDKWRKGTARPNGKERMKELGMALGMDESELNAFLYRNGYPPLFYKNPFDSAARLTLFRYPGDREIVTKYRKIINDLGLDEIEPSHRNSLESAVMGMELMNAAREDRVSTWFRKREGNFTADGKNMILGQQLVRFLLLYLGDATVNELAVTGELPVTLRNLLYPVLGGKAVAVRHLREKLIAWGLYSNMTEDEIDVLLKCARLRPVSEPETKSDEALLMAIRFGHERYPLYEYQNVSTVLSRLRAGFVSDPELEREYAQRLKLCEQLSDYYMNSEHSEDEKAFERLYTSYSDKGLMDYVHDILVSLRKGGELDASDTDHIIEYTARAEGGKSIWN